MRKLATIRKISEVRNIPEADRICTYVIDGWTIVDNIGAYNVGDIVIMCEIDSWVPHELAPFLSKGTEPRIYEGVKGERLRTVKLRKQLSQGLILPVSKLPFNVSANDVGMDVTEALGILKYEKPINVKLSGIVRGNFPSFIPKTDQERIQNLTDSLGDWVSNSLEFEVTEKLDGTSVTIYKNSMLEESGKDAFGVCSRNLDLKETEENVYWNVAKKFDVHSILLRDGRNLAIQGEIIGCGIQGNQYKLDSHELYVFDIYDIDNRRYFNSGERLAFCAANNLKHVPVHSRSYVIPENNIQALLDMAEGVSYLNTSQREGLVFKCLTDPSISFKAISNGWLLKNE